MVTKRSEKAGLPPGTLVPVRSRGESATVLKAFTYDEGSYKEITVPQVADVPPCADGTITWIDIDGLADLRTMNDLGERFGLHALMIEDILNTDQRPKIEEYQDHLFVVVKMLTLDEETGGLNTEQVSLVLGHNYVISLQERPGDILDPVRDRIRNGTGRVRKKGADYLLYALLDVIVDHYFKVVDALGERIAALERKVLVKPGNEDL
ncbi:MAG TPA: CorA family divalent cation transporter, partial [Flavobacteriales bacterium]|nr:CorA family divalent cation transporter [Flavobacteriales bacterium]